MDHFHSRDRVLLCEYVPLRKLAETHPASRFTGLDLSPEAVAYAEAGAAHLPNLTFVLGDATLAQTLDSVNLARAASVAIMTSSDIANIETGLAVRDRLQQRWEEVSDAGRQLMAGADFSPCLERSRAQRDVAVNDVRMQRRQDPG